MPNNKFRHQIITEILFLKKILKERQCIASILCLCCFDQYSICVLCQLKCCNPMSESFFLNTKKKFKADIPFDQV